MAMLILLVLLIFFAALGIPLAFAIGASCVTYILIYAPTFITMLPQRVWNGAYSELMIAMPLFMLAGELMNTGGITQRIINFCMELLRPIRGGLGEVNIVASMIFGGISGSAVADVSSLGKIEIPMMEDAGYNKDFSICVTVSSACQGLLIPPSHNMVLYAMTAGGVSVGKLFLAGYAPGILLGVALMALCYIFAIKRNYPKGDPVSFKEALVITKDAVFAIGAMFIIVGGVVAGLFTATEAAAIGCIYCLLVATLVYRQLSLKDMGRILYNTVKTLAMIYSLIAAAGAFAWMMAYLRIPAKFTGILMDVSDNKIVVLLLINVLLLLLGCIMDMAPLILIMTPILLPVVQKFGMDPVQFGIMLIANLAIGLLTPPVGSCLYAGCAVGGAKIEKVTKCMLPFYLTMVVVLLMITFIPALSMTLPNLMM